MICSMFISLSPTLCCGDLIRKIDSETELKIMDELGSHKTETNSRKCSILSVNYNYCTLYNYRICILYYDR